MIIGLASPKSAELAGRLETRGGVDVAISSAKVICWQNSLFFGRGEFSSTDWMVSSPDLIRPTMYGE